MHPVTVYLSSAPSSMLIQLKWDLLLSLGQFGHPLFLYRDNGGDNGEHVCGVLFHGPGICM